ncbi:hypothetical protein U0070_015268 [Myodes glareolus]|uniref:Uncharacterized protein n=1 Tax=Myodes glareolus TaxID=447135 RepID=A0AAW0K0T7_MYOGA
MPEKPQGCPQLRLLAIVERVPELAFACDQSLLQAEKQATEKLLQAQKSKNQRLKQITVELGSTTYRGTEEVTAKETTALGSQAEDTQEKITILQMQNGMNSWVI